MNFELNISSRILFYLNNSNKYAAYPTYLNRGRFSVCDTRKPAKSDQFFYYLLVSTFLSSTACKEIMLLSKGCWFPIHDSCCMSGRRFPSPKHDPVPIRAEATTI